MALTVKSASAACGQSTRCCRQAAACCVCFVRGAERGVHAYCWCLSVASQVLLEAGIKTADAVVLGSGPPVGAELEADARILSAVLQVRRQTAAAVWACAVTAADRQLEACSWLSVGLGRRGACVQCVC